MKQFFTEILDLREESQEEKIKVNTDNIENES